MKGGAGRERERERERESKREIKNERKASCERGRVGGWAKRERVRAREGAREKERESEACWKGGREEWRKRGRDGMREPILIQGGKKREGDLVGGKANLLLMCC